MWQWQIRYPTPFSLVLCSAASTAMRKINQRAEHSSPRDENLRLTRDTHFLEEPASGAQLVFPLRPRTVCTMNKTVIEVQVRAVLPTSGGCAVFLGNNEKVFIIYVDQTVGSAITMFMRHITKERPLTHDLMAHLLAALGAKVERVIINDLKNATYYARVIIQVENELQQKKIIELDGRPSDCIAMATQQKAPIYVSQDVWDEVDDMSDVLRKMEEEGLKTDPETEE